ncbi:hypothetical protein [Euzebyella marina]|nr:hypothetical protein [Euzebyella marina]
MQFEIRFTRIIDFPKSVYDEISPFAGLSTTIEIANELSSKDCMISLLFADDFTEIHIKWDRVFFKCTTHKDDWLKNNNFVEEPFLNLFKRLKASKNFGKISNILFLGVFVEDASGKDLNIERINKNFAEKYLTETCANGVLKGFSDVGIVFDKKESTSEVNVQFGPYKGLEDLKKLGFETKDMVLAEKISKPSQIMKYKYLQLTDSLNFAKFKSIYQAAVKIVDSQWK